MTTEFMVAETAPPYRLPTRDVWETVTRLDRRDPKTGAVKKTRAVIVRWRRPTGGVSEKRFWEALEAEKFAQSKREAIRRGTADSAKADMKFSEWAEAFMTARYPNYLKWKRREIKALGNEYGSHLEETADEFALHVGDRPLSDYRSSDFDRFRSSLTTNGSLRETKRKKAPLRATTIESHLQRVRTIFRAAEADGLITQRCKIEVNKIAYEKPVIEKAEIEDILKAAAEWPPSSKARRGARTGRLRPILIALYYTMVRRAELVHLTWADVRWENGHIVEILIQPKEDDIGGVQHRWEPKDREVRAIPVHPRLAEVLETLHEHRDHPRWVFTDTKGGRWNISSLVSLMRRFERASGFELGFHIWRRSGLTHLHDAGAPLKDIQAIAGHSVIATTLRYVRSSAKGQRQTILKLT